MDKVLDVINKLDLPKLIASFSVSVGAKIIGAVLVLIIGFKLCKFIVKIITNMRALKNVDPSAQSFIKSFMGIFLKVVVVITAAGVLGVPMTSVITVVGSCGIAVGLALQGGLSNLAGGLIILIFKPFQVNDYIIEGGYEGTVSSIGIFYTTLVTVDNKRILIPNGTLMNSTITAANQLDTRRIDFAFNTSYSTDIDFAREILTLTAEKDPRVLKEPSPQVFVSKHGESAIELTLRVWTKTADYWDVYFALNENVKKAFDENEIEIPFPQMDVHIKPQS